MCSIADYYDTDNNKKVGFDCFSSAKEINSQPSDMAKDLIKADPTFEYTYNIGVAGIEDTNVSQPVPTVLEDFARFEVQSTVSIMAKTKTDAYGAIFVGDAPRQADCSIYQQIPFNQLYSLVGFEGKTAYFHFDRTLLDNQLLNIFEMDILCYTQKPVFDIGDNTIPMVRGADGYDVPMSIHQDGSPKIFKVVGRKMIYDGAVWQELTLQEYTE